MFKTIEEAYPFLEVNKRVNKRVNNIYFYLSNKQHSYYDN